MLLLCTKEVIVDATEGKATTVQTDGNANNIAVVYLAQCCLVSIASVTKVREGNRYTM